MKFLSRYHYFKPIKIIRDLVHGYINLTPFDLELIDTVEFQRLKDIRQLTCQHVYPSARHTRFEHSLGVLELTRQAIKHLNINGFIHKKGQDIEIINEHLQFNASIAALLHDVGHCPFSHMGEKEFNSKEVLECLIEDIKQTEELKLCFDLIQKLSIGKNVGSVHEQLSCILILGKFKDKLDNINILPINTDDECEISVDYELILRCILGIEYDISTTELIQQNILKNTIVNLINSNIFDMDKLDYIMRDSFFTGIGTPCIDTKRLFRNMYLSEKYNLVFTSRSVPVLQNMIDSRDGLYMYVYNHHAVILSDFINTYISRRLSHNSLNFLSIIYPKKNSKQINAIAYNNFHISSLGLVPKPYLFSINSIVELNRSDSDWISLLNIINTNYTNDENTIKSLLESNIDTYVKQQSQIQQILSTSSDEIFRLTKKIKTMFDLIKNFKTRNFLKPWWKTVFEFNNFINQHFRDDKIKKTVCQFICNGGKYGLEASEFRSQIAKHVIYITQRLCEDYPQILSEPLQSGEFFIVERSNRFLNLEAIEKLEIALKSNEMIGSPNDVNYKTGEYYIKNLTNIIPQKDYKSIYVKEGFYIFSKTYNNDENSNKYYSLIEKIFVFTASEFVYEGEQKFIEFFSNLLTKEALRQNEEKSNINMYEKFKRNIEL